MTDLLTLATSVVDQARPGESMEVYVTRGTENEVRAYEGAVESLTSADSSGVGIRLILDGPEGEGSRLGFAWAGSLDPTVIEAALSDARDNARYATPDPDVVLAVPDGQAAVDIDLWDDRVASTAMDAKIALAIDLERATRGADPRIRQVSSADYSDARTEVALASTTGIRSTARRTTASVSVDAIAGDAADTQTGTGFSVGRSPADLDSDWAQREAVERATRLLGARKAQSGRCTVIFDPRVVSTLLSVVASALSGEAVVKGRSFFAGRIGEVVAHPSVTLVDDPTDPRAFAAAAYDAEGLACRRNILIEDGVLRMFVFDTVSARRAQTRSTGSAVRGGFAGTPSAGCRALLLAPGTQGAEEILASVGDALYVQSVTGMHSGVNPVSGDFSVGAEGLMVRNGVFAEPVREVTVASMLQRMLQSVVAIGSDVRWLPGVAAGQTLAIGDMQLSGDN
ncbi:MAG TPA: TldD/PmbA family protein [Acidimicrobiales bacterium]|jgi:PmbA protein|nr:TldD/PmbA family protein [Acidimicrobiales bacterium]